MSFSLNEIEATAKKATRGAGYPWGLAEEAGKATRWLCAHGVDGCMALADLLHRVDGADLAGFRPQVTKTPWVAPNGVLCPLITGATLSDLGANAVIDSIRLGAVASPVLLAPFVAPLAKDIERPVSLALDDTVLVVTGNTLSGPYTPPACVGRVALQIGRTQDAPNTLQERATPDPAIWSALLSFAHRTYAPATEASRQKGAGAGLSDTD